MTEVRFTNPEYPQKGDRRRLGSSLIYTCERVTLGEDGIRVRGPYSENGVPASRECNIDLFTWVSLEELPPEPTWAPKVGDYYQGERGGKVVRITAVDPDAQKVKAQGAESDLWYSPAEKSVPGFQRVTITPAPEDDDA
jgi:hypothetical protein